MYKAISAFMLFVVLALAEATIHQNDDASHRGHDGNVFDDAASVLDNFFG